MVMMMHRPLGPHSHKQNILDSHHHLPQKKIKSPQTDPNCSCFLEAKAKAGDAQGQGREDAVPAEESQAPQCSQRPCSHKRLRDTLIKVI